MRLFIITLTLLFILPGLTAGAGRKISEVGNKHNFSVTNIDASVNYRAITAGDNPSYPVSSQICVFCHTPHHSSSEGPLWNRKASQKSFFQHYSSPTLALDDAAVKTASEYGQPNGSTRLCLSCHDGVTALGAVFTTPGTTTAVNIQFTDGRGGQGANVTLGYETYSTHHPVSFNYDQNVRNLLNSAPYNKNLIYSPPSTNEVMLDKNNRMQCTTCHDPHQDKSDTPSILTPMWSTTTYTKACATCHIVEPLYPWKP